MAATIVTAVSVVFFGLTFVVWRRYLWAAEKVPDGKTDTCPYSLTDVFGDRHLVNVPHQEGVRWLTEIFSRSARRFPGHTALQIPHTGESLTFAELDAQAGNVAAALSPFLTGPDQVVAVAMAQDNWHIVASHLGILRAGGTFMFLDTALPDALITHMLEDAQPVAVLTRGQDTFRDLPTLDIQTVPERNGPGVKSHVISSVSLLRLMAISCKYWSAACACTLRGDTGSRRRDRHNRTRNQCLRDFMDLL